MLLWLLLAFRQISHLPVASYMLLRPSPRYFTQHAAQICRIQFTSGLPPRQSLPYNLELAASLMKLVSEQPWKVLQLNGSFDRMRSFYSTVIKERNLHFVIKIGTIHTVAEYSNITRYGRNNSFFSLFYLVYNGVYLNRDPRNFKQALW